MSAANNKAVSSEYEQSPTPQIIVNTDSSIRGKRSNVESGLRVMQSNAGISTKLSQPPASSVRKPTQSEVENFQN